MKHRQVHLDVLRILAAFFVLVNHTEQFICLKINYSATWIVSVLYFFCCKVAVPIFLMISGSLLLGRQDSYRKHASRIIRIVLVILVFSIVYYLQMVWYGETEFNLWEYFPLIYHKNITNAFWYLYLYLGILIMLPLLQRMAAGMKQRDYLYYFCIAFGFVGVMPILIEFFPQLQYSNQLNLAFFNANIGMLLAGYYVDHYMVVTKKKAVCAGIVFVLCIGISYGITYLKYLEYGLEDKKFFVFDNRELSTIGISSICVYILVKYFCDCHTFSERVQKGLAYVGGCTFGIYLLGDWIGKWIRWNYDYVFHPLVHPLVDCFVIDLLIFGICLVLTSVLKRIPGIRKLL